jgi:hypothetical protein
MGGMSVSFKWHRQRHWWHSLRKHVDIYLEGLKIYKQQWIIHKHNISVWSYNQTCKMMWTDIPAAQQYLLNRPGRSNSVIKRQYRIWCSHSSLCDVWGLEGCNTASSGSRSQCFKYSECLHLQDQTDQASWAAWPRWRQHNPFKLWELLTCWHVSHLKALNLFMSLH